MLRKRVFDPKHKNLEREVVLKDLLSRYLRNLSRLYAIAGIIISGSTVCGMAQNMIEGHVLSSDKKPLESVNVLLRSRLDSTLIDATATDSLGHYILPRPKTPFVTSYSFVGLKTLVLPYDPSLQTYRNVILEEDAHVLDEVIVSARQVRTRPIAGGIACSISNKSLLSNRSVVDLLSYVPFVANAGLERFRVADKQDVVFFINGRRSHMSATALFSYLRSLSAAQVISFKVLHQPPLEYGVEDNCAVIDLIIEDNNVGFQGSIRGELTHTHYWKQSASSMLIYQSPLWRVQMHASARNLRDYERSLEQTYYPIISQQIEGENKSNTRRRQLDFNLTSEYQLSERHLLGASLDLYRYKGNPYTSKTNLYRTLEVDSIFSGVLHRKYTDQYVATTLYYQGSLSNGIAFSSEINALWSDYKHRMQYQYERADLATHPIYLDYQAHLPMNTNSYGAKVKVAIPINQRLHLNVGTQANYHKANYSERYEIQVLPSNYRFDDQALHYDETSLLSYAMLRYRFPFELECYAGLYTQYHLTDGAYNAEARQRYNDRWYPLPYLNISWSSGKLWLSYNFSMWNKYHTFTAFSPFKRWNSLTSYTQGNPDLRPSRSFYHVLSTRYGNFFAKLTYSQTRDAVASLPLLEDDNIISNKQYNYGTNHALGLSMGYGANITPWWYINSNISTSRLTTKISKPKLPAFSAEEWFFDGSISNGFTLSEQHNWSADVSLSYSAPYRWLYNTQDGMMQCNINVNKSIGDFSFMLWAYKSWQHSLGHGIHSWGLTEMATPSFWSKRQSWGEDMGIAFSVSYTFGKSSLKRRIEPRRADASRVITE